MKKVTISMLMLMLLSGWVLLPSGTAQFYENFEGEPEAEWRTFTGDGGAVSEITFRDGFARLTVDGSEDRRNVWWAIMETTVSDQIDLEQLARPEYELRVETRIRSSSPYKRVNLHFNTQRTVDFHSHLMEFGLPDTENWHKISMTTSGFDGRPGDTVNGHLAMMDWGPGLYWVDMDSYRVDVVRADEAGPEYGEQVVYTNERPDPAEFLYDLPVDQAGMIDRQYPDVNLAGWQEGGTSLLTTDGTKTILLRWDLEQFEGRTVEGYGMLELHLSSYFQAFGTGLHEFDKVRLVEILGGNDDWTRQEVTYDNFTEGRPLDEILNTQMISDIDMPRQHHDVIRLRVPRPVIQRMVDGETLGIAMYPLGSLQASFRYGGENRQLMPRLYMNF